MFRLIILFLIYIIMSVMTIGSISFCYAEENTKNIIESMKINSINFDNSDSIIFLGTSSNENFKAGNITKKTLTEPDRVYFDIENALITFPNSTYELKNSRLKQVKIAQNSTSPDVVRIVLWSSENYDSSQIEVLKIKNNIIIKLGSEKPLQQYLTQVYKESRESDIEYYDKSIVIAEGKKKEEADEIFNSVQKAFSLEGQELVRPNIEQKQARLKSRYFLENVIIKNNDILLSGIGVINIEKPFILSDPYRIVFDLPNTIVLQELRDKEIKISEKTSIKIGQFEPSKARIVIKTAETDYYKPVYSTNLQTLYLTNKSTAENITNTSLKTEISSFKEQNINNNAKEINIIFNNPVIYSIQKDNEKLNLTIFNLANFDYELFNKLADKKQNKFKAQKIGLNTYILSFPFGKNTLVDCYETLNASQLRIVAAGIEEKQNIIHKIKQDTEEKKSLNIKLKPILDNKNKKKQNKENEEKNIITKLNKKLIIIDPGHGGTDTGALRNNILEKDLTLSIGLKVREELRKKGLTNIVMTRTDDTTLSLDERVQTANNNNAAIFVSIHINASVKSEIKGIETHYYTEQGYGLAQIMHKELIKNINASDRGLFKSKFYVINHTEAPSVLLELGFISNENERKELTGMERQNKSAEAIAEGIVKFLTEQLYE